MAVGEVNGLVREPKLKGSCRQKDITVSPSNHFIFEVASPPF